MSSFKSYFSKNNTLIYGSVANTGQNPVTELFFGNVDNLITQVGYSRFIFDIDLENLKSRIDDGTIIRSTRFCERPITHTLHMKNTSSFDKELLNDNWSNGRRRASSFTLNLYRIPYTLGNLIGEPQYWDEGVGYDYYESTNSGSSGMEVNSSSLASDKSFSTRPSNFFQNKTTSFWSTPMIYSNVEGDGATIHTNDVYLIDSQEFQFGNEDIMFDMTKEIENRLNGLIETTGYIIAFSPDIELIGDLTENYSVGFFTRHTQTFYEPYLETSYDDLVHDDRSFFVDNFENTLYLYSYENGIPKNLDKLPTVDILDLNFDPILGYTGISTCQVTKGIYECKIDGLTADTIPCMFYDKWTGLEIDGKVINDVENTFIMDNYSKRFDVGINSYEPNKYSFNFSGIKQDEKILSSDIRKINVQVKKAYSSNSQIFDLKCYYRVYVREGEIEVQVQDWTEINRTPNNYYFNLDMNDKIPNEYHVDFKVITNNETNTYKRELKFQVVSKK